MRTPLRRVALGLLLVAVDWRVSGVDVVLDPVGWLLVIAAIRRLAAGDRFARPLLWALWAAVALSLPDLVGWAAVAPVYNVVLCVALLLLCHYLALRAARDGDVRAERQWSVLRNLVLGLTAVSIFVAVLGGAGPWPLFAVLLVLAWLVTVALILIQLIRHDCRGWALPAG